MPIYEYECKVCGNRHEVMQRVSDAPITTCPACEGEVHRVLSPSGLSFKGGGWYITDYARKGKDSDSKSPPKKEPPKSAAEKKEGVATPSSDVSSKKEVKGEQ